MPLPLRDAGILLANACATWVTVFVNKFLFVNMGFEFPVFVTAIHYLICAMLMSALHSSGAFTRIAFTSLSRDAQRELAVLIVVFSVGPVLSNLSLSVSSVGFYQLSKLAVTPLIVAAEWWLYGKTLSARRLGALAVVVAGVALSSLMDVQLSVAAALVAAVLLPVATTYKVISSRVQTSRGLSTTQLMDLTFAPAFAIGTVQVLLFDDVRAITRVVWTPALGVVLVLSGLAAFAINYTGFLVVGQLSALTHQLSGQGKTAVGVLLGLLLYDTRGSSRILWGAALAMAGMGMYTHWTLAENEAKRARAAATSEGAKTIAV